MARRVVFFEDHLAATQFFVDILRLRGFEVVQVQKPEDCEIEFNHMDFEVFVCTKTTPESWVQCQKIIALHGQVPVLYILDRADAKNANLKIDDLHQVVRPTCNKQNFLYRITALGRIGKLYRQIKELSRLATGSTAVDQMFTHLDVHHILDRMLSYFGSRLDLKNIYWLRWSALQPLLKAEQKSLVLEMEVAEMRSPRVMSLHETELQSLFTLLGETLSVHELSERANDSYWSKQSGKTNLMYVVVQNLNGESPLGVLLFEGLALDEQETLAPQIVETLRLMARYVEFGLSHWDSKNMAMIDDLTELYNQRFLPIALDNEISRAKRRGANFSVLFLDLDYFKQVNDTKGHWIGSKLLKEVGGILKTSIRSCDYGFRYGGDEFVVILPDTDIHGGQIVAERIRKVIESTHFMIDGHEIRLTVSVGLAGYPHHAVTREEIIQLADQAMYYGKRKSRNIVYVAS